MILSLLKYNKMAVETFILVQSSKTQVYQLFHKILKKIIALQFNFIYVKSAKQPVHLPKLPKTIQCKYEENLIFPTIFRRVPFNPLPLINVCVCLKKVCPIVMSSKTTKTWSIENCRGHTMCPSSKQLVPCENYTLPFDYMTFLTRPKTFSLK